MVEVLIEAWANPNSRRLDGSTALLMTAFEGFLDTIKVLLRSGANPLLAATDPSGSGQSAVPLDMAAQNGRTWCLSWCGSWGSMVAAAKQAVGELSCQPRRTSTWMLWQRWGVPEWSTQHLEVVATLGSAGVVDTGWALTAAAGSGSEVSVGLLLQ